MDIEILKTLPNLGVGIASVVVIFFIVKAALQHLSDSHTAFRTYVTENNHKTTEILVQARDNIAESTQAIKGAASVMEQVRDHLIRHEARGRK